MTTKKSIIADALAEIGLATYIFDASPEELEAFLKKLNQMAAEWDGLGIRVGYNFGGDINAEMGVPDTVENCFVTNLAVRIGPGQGKSVPPDTKVAAANGYNAMLTANIIIPQARYPNTMPIGTGNRRGVLDRQYYQRWRNGYPNGGN